MNIKPKRKLEPNEQGPWKSINATDEEKKDDARLDKLLEGLFITQSQSPKLTNKDVDAELYSDYLDKDITKI